MTAPASVAHDYHKIRRLKHEADMALRRKLAAERRYDLKADRVVDVRAAVERKEPGLGSWHVKQSERALERAQAEYVRRADEHERIVREACSG